MGFSDRLGDIASGFGGAIQAAFGLVKDFAVAPFKDEDEFNGFIHTAYSRTKKRGGDFLGELFGPKEGFGALIGAIPRPVRKVGDSVLDPTFEAIETIYQEGVDRPLGTILTAGSLVDSDTEDHSFFSGDTWKKAYEIADKRNIGQVVALMGGTEDILNKAEVARYVATDSYEHWAGTVNALSRIFADPTIIGGKAAKLARTKYVTRPIKTTRDIDKAVSGSGFARFASAIEGKTAGEIRDQFFPNERQGALISTVFAEASDKGLAARALMGDIDALRTLGDIEPSVAAPIARNLDLIAKEKLPPGQIKLWEEAEITGLLPEEMMRERLDAVAGPLNTAPRVRGRVRTSITRSEFYQRSAIGKPVRLAFNMRPQRLVDLHDPAGDVQLARMLRKSEMDVPYQDKFRSRYMAAVSESDRLGVLLEAEAAAVKSIAERAGMTVAEIEDVLSKSKEYRGRADAILKSRKYDGEGRSRVRLSQADGFDVDTEVPLMVSQNANVFALPELDEIKKAASAVGRFKLRHPTSQVPGELMNKFYRVWKPGVLLRLGWPIRVVGDEQLRILTKIGVLTHAETLAKAAGRNVKEKIARVPKGKRGHYYRDIRGYEVESAFGAPGDADNVFRHLTSSRASFERLASTADDAVRKELAQHTGEFRSYSPFDEGYGDAWAHNVNNQLAQDPLARRLVEGKSFDAVKDWLRTTEGKAYASRIADVRRRNPDEWLRGLQEQVDSYLPTDDLKAAALQRTLTADDLVRAVPDANARPTVHGEILAQAKGTDVVGGVVSKSLTNLFKWLGSQPSDVMSRNRFFEAMYNAETERLVNLLGDQMKLSADDIKKIEKSARHYALGETKKLLYDLAEESELSALLSNIAPFYNAWQEVITRWVGLAVENPDRVAKLRQVWKAPERFGIVTDEKGNAVKDGDDPEEAYITIRVPEWAKDIPGLRTQGAIKFNKKSLNLALQGSPGFGPIVQIPINAIVKDRPDLEKSMEFVLPYGTTPDWKQLVMPTWLKRQSALAKGEEDRAYRNTLLRIYWDKVTDYNLGKRDDKPTWEEARDETSKFFRLRTVASVVLPAAISFNSPYQLYIDAYRALREQDTQTADERFLEQYGEEYFALTQSLSRSMDGVPPTLEGAAARKKYQNLIEKHPELGSLIVGAEGAGEFARAVYDAQLTKPLKPGSDKKQRDAFSFEEATRAPEVRLGWIEYRKAMDLIEAERIQRGLPNLQVKQAKDLAQMKRGFIEKLSEKYPEWYSEFSITDRNKNARRLDAMREIVQDKRLSGRDDIQGLAEYLRARDVLAAALGQRKAKTLTAASNQDLARTWENIKGALIEKNLAFSALYYRWLESDFVEAA